MSLKKDASLLLLFETVCIIGIVIFYTRALSIYYGIVIGITLISLASINLFYRTNTIVDYKRLQLLRVYPFGILIGTIFFTLLCLFFPDAAMGHIQYFVFVWMGIVIWRTFWIIASLRQSSPFLASHLSGVYPIAALSATISLTIILVFPPVALPGPDSIGYINYARALLGETNVPLYFYIRTPLLPSLIILSGTFFTNSFQGFILLQAFLSFWGPVFIYGILRSVTRVVVAELGALFAMATLMPYTYNQTVFTETPYIFLLLLATYLSVICIVNGRIRYAYAVAIVLVLIYLVRPSASLISVLFISAFFLFRPRQWRHFLAAALVMIATVFGANLFFQSRLTGAQVLSLSPASQTGSLLFFNIYLSHVANPDSPIFSPEDGPATTEMLTLLQEHFTEHPETLSELDALMGLASTPEQYETLYGQYLPDMDALAQAMLTHPSLSYYSVLIDSLIDVLGVEQADQLLTKVVLEHLPHDPGVIFRYTIINLKAFFIGPSFSHDRLGNVEYINYGLPFNQITPQLMLNQLSPALAQDVVNRQTPELLIHWERLFYIILRLWTPFFTVLRPIVFLGALISPIFLFRNKQQRALVFLCFTVVAYSGLVVSVFAEPLYRYTYHTFLFECILVVLLINTGYEQLQKRMKQASG